MKKSKKKIPSIYLLLCALVLNLSGYILISCNKSNKKTAQADATNYSGQLVANNYVGDQVCKNCHAKEYDQWKQSDHYHSMEKATDQSVRGNFDNVTFKNGGISYRFYKTDGKFMVQTLGADGKYHNYTVRYTFGWEPLQQYLIRFPRGKYQALTVAWDTQKKRWFSLYPNQKINPESFRDWLFWTNGGMNWNNQCADCHSTNLRQHYIARSDSFHTTWSVINVSCESCHGPGKKHVTYVESLKGKKPDMAIIRRGLLMTRGTSSHRLVDECARCHSRREEITRSHDLKGRFLDSYIPQLPHPDHYYGDGQIKDEDYVYASYLQSKMYHYGIACTNCHNPHTMHLKLPGNQLCSGCHDPKKYDTQSHIHHKMNTKAALCINCHMPGKNYMQVDFRRDHSFRLPRPDLTEKYGVPNACNSCHDHKSAKWAANAIRKWYGDNRNSFYHFTGVLAKASKEGPSSTEMSLIDLVKDRSQPAIARATAIWYLGQVFDDSSRSIIRESLNDQSPLVRLSAVTALSQLPPDRKRKLLVTSLIDSVRAIRVTAASALAGFTVSDLPENARSAFRKASRGLREEFEITRYFPAGQMNIGLYYEKKSEWNRAIGAYQKALDKDPHFNAARINLAYLYNRLGRTKEAELLFKAVIRQEPGYGPAYYSLALLISGDGNLKKALTYFKEAADRMPQNARVYYNWAIALQKLKRYKESEVTYKRALSLEPNNSTYQYGIVTLYLQQKKYAEALPHLRKLQQLEPGNPQYERLLEMAETKADNSE